MKVTHIFILVVLVMVFSYSTTGSQENFPTAKSDSINTEVSSVYKLKRINDSVLAVMEINKELTVTKKQLSTYQYLRKELLAYSYRMKNVVYSKKPTRDTIFKYIYIDEENNSKTIPAREKNIKENDFIEPRKDSSKQKKDWFIKRLWNKIF